jgi:hypothetical protein
MLFHILKIILWPNRPNTALRIVELAPTGVNVISGGSKTGKSAIIPIIDYCLASDKCAVPVEAIRNSCAWFGILIETSEGQKLLARREPGGQRSTSEMYIAEASSVQIPQTTPEKNTTSDAVKTRLDELCGLSRLDFDTQGTGSGFKGRPSFRDLMAFTFQPQNIIANPDVLFFKADTYEHREKLKTIFPYVLNAVTPAVLAAQHELESVRRTIARKERELTNLRNLSERWNAELRALAVQARELSLIAAPLAPDATREHLLGALRAALEITRRGSPDAAGIGEAMAELAQLQTEERGIDASIRALRKRLGEMTKLKATIEQYGNSLAIQRDRLAVSKWLHSLEDTNHACPVCESPLQQPADKLQELYDSLLVLEQDLKTKKAAPASFDREMVRVKDELQTQAEKLRGVSLRKSEVESRSEEVKQIGFREAEASRFLGRVEKSLELQQALQDDGTLASELASLRSRERELADTVATGTIENKKRRALEKVALFAGRLLPDLDAERPLDPIELSITDLTITVKGAEREDYLWEIGSGANWLSYHVAVSLGLQQFFIDSNHSPIPSFLVYDQPSQVYFPRKLARSTPSSEPVIQDEDIEAVRMVFKTVANAAAATKDKLQVLVLDHAGSDVWGEVPGIHLVEEWREGRKLVPTDWLAPIA